MFGGLPGSKQKIGQSFPRGTTLLFWQAAAPIGWTKLTTQNDKALRVVSGTGGISGGTNAFSAVMAQTVVGSHAITTAELPVIGFMTSGGGGPEGTSSANQVRFVQVTAGSGNAHNHSITMDIQYIDLILAKKN
jgi:hypothetical protein